MSCPRSHAVCGRSAVKLVQSGLITSETLLRKLVFPQMGLCRASPRPQSISNDSDRGKGEGVSQLEQRGRLPTDDLRIRVYYCNLGTVGVQVQCREGEHL